MLIGEKSTEVSYRKFYIVENFDTFGSLEYLGTEIVNQDMADENDI
jgi:hypothetical protein